MKNRDDGALGHWLETLLRGRDHVDVPIEEMVMRVGLPPRLTRPTIVKALNAIAGLRHPIALSSAIGPHARVRILRRVSGRVSRFSLDSLPVAPKAAQRRRRQRRAGHAGVGQLQTPQTCPLVTGTTYRVLSIQPPWAWAIFHAGKDVENRSWSTNHRGPLLIHASSRQFGGDSLEEVRELIADASGIAPDQLPTEFPRSQLLGLVDLEDITEDSRSPWAEDDNEHWVLARPLLLDQPVLKVNGIGNRIRADSDGA